MSGTASARRLAVLALGVLAVLTIVVLSGGDDGRTLRIDVRDRANVRTGDPVRVAGVAVGKVVGLGLRGDGRGAELTVRIDGWSVVIRRDARAALRWTTLLGGAYFVDLDPGSASAAVDTSGRIPATRTTTQVTFDDVLQTFSGDAPAALRTLLSQSRQAFSATGAIGTDVELLGPTLKTVGRGASALRGQTPGDLRRLVRATSRTVSGLGRNDRRLRRLVDGAAGTLQVTATNSGALGRLVAAAPATLDDTRRTAARIGLTLDHLDPLAVQLRPAARELAPALRATTPVLVHATSTLRSLRPLLTALSPAVRSLQRASTTGVPLIAALTPILERVDGRLIPFLDRRDAGTGHRTREMIGPTLAVANAAGTEFDGHGALIRFAPQFGESVLLGSPCQTSLTDPSAKQPVRCDRIVTALQHIFGGPGR